LEGEFVRGLLEMVVSALLVTWYLDRPKVLAGGHPQDQRLCRQHVLILLSHPAKQHKTPVQTLICSVKLRL